MTEEHSEEDLAVAAQAYKKTVADHVALSNRSGKQILRAVSELLTTYSTSGALEGVEGNVLGSVPQTPTANELVEKPTGVAQYQSLTLLAATIRWASHVTGRTEDEIVESMSENFTTEGEHPNYLSD